jgi:hypothetical protein
MSSADIFLSERITETFNFKQMRETILAHNRSTGKRARIDFSQAVRGASSGGLAHWIDMSDGCRLTFVNAPDWLLFHFNNNADLLACGHLESVYLRFENPVTKEMPFVTLRLGQEIPLTPPFKTPLQPVKDGSGNSLEPLFDPALVFDFIFRDGASFVKMWRAQ